MKRLTMIALAALCAVLVATGCAKPEVEPVVLALTPVPAPPSAPSPTPQLVETAKLVNLASMSGTVRVVSEGVGMQGYAGMRLAGGDNVSTQAASRADLELDQAKLVMLDENSEIQINDSGSAGVAVTLLKGMLVNDIPSGSTYTVEAKNMTMGVLGTVFCVYFDGVGDAKVALLEGRLSITPKGADAPFTLEAGNEFTASEANIQASLESGALHTESIHYDQLSDAALTCLTDALAPRDAELSGELSEMLTARAEEAAKAEQKDAKAPAPDIAVAPPQPQDVPKPIESEEEGHSGGQPSWPDVDLGDDPAVEDQENPDQGYPFVRLKENGAAFALGFSSASVKVTFLPLPGMRYYYKIDSSAAGTGAEWTKIETKGGHGIQKFSIPWSSGAAALSDGEYLFIRSIDRHDREGKVSMLCKDATPRIMAEAEGDGTKLTLLGASSEDQTVYTCKSPHVSLGGGTSSVVLSGVTPEQAQSYEFAPKAKECAALSKGENGEPYTLYVRGSIYPQAQNQPTGTEATVTLGDTELKITFDGGALKISFTPKDGVSYLYCVSQQNSAGDVPGQNIPPSNLSSISNGALQVPIGESAQIGDSRWLFLVSNSQGGGVLGMLKIKCVLKSASGDAPSCALKSPDSQEGNHYILELYKPVLGNTN